MRPVQWVFFDLDGTLADSLPGLRGSIAEAFAVIGRTLPEVDLRPFIGPGIRVILRNLDGALTETELDRMEKVFRSSYDTRGVLETSLFPGAEATLRQLREAGFELFVITNKPKLATAALIDKFNLRAVFTAVVSRNSREPAFASKQEMLTETVAQHDVDPARSLMVGDTIEDMHAARAAGMRFVQAQYGYGVIPQEGQVILEQLPHMLSLCVTA